MQKSFTLLLIWGKTASNRSSDRELVWKKKSVYLKSGRNPWKFLWRRFLHRYFSRISLCFLAICRLFWLFFFLCFFFCCFEICRFFWVFFFFFFFFNFSEQIYLTSPGLQANFIKKETLAQVFHYEFCEIFKNNFFTKHLRWLLP